MKKILIIEDDAGIAEIERDYLSMSGYEVSIADNGDDGLKMYLGGGFNLVILDLMLPGRSGYDILERISDTKDIPVIIVSAKDEEMSKIKGLNLGADDYVTKPFGMGELVARVNRLIKSYEKFRGGEVNGTVTVRGITVDESGRRVYVDGTEVILKQKEFDVLLFLMKNPNRVYSKESIFERVWGYDALSDASTVTVHIARIREKIEKNPSKPEYIETVWGAGYRFIK